MVERLTRLAVETSPLHSSPPGFECCRARMTNTDQFCVLEYGIMLVESAESGYDTDE